MSVKAAFPAIMAILLLWAALSTGSTIFFMGAVLLILMLLSSLISVLLACRTLTVDSTLSAPMVRRGEDVTVEISVCHRCPFPIAPIELELTAAPGMPETVIRLRDMPGKQQKVTMPFHAAHVGVSRPGIRSCTVTDLFGFFARRITGITSGMQLAVVPGTFPTDPLEFSPGDPGSEAMARATEDISSPSDVRSYQQGDALKKIHWKLSARKG